MRKGSQKKQDPQKHYDAHYDRIQKALHDIAGYLGEAKTDANWADVGSLGRWGGQLEEIADAMLGRGEYAETDNVTGNKR